MNIEIIEFYPFQKDETNGYISGTIRVRLLDLRIELLGIYVKRQKGRWLFNHPARNGTDHSTGKSVRYPFIVFADKEQQKALMAAIREKAPVFIEKRLLDNTKPLIFPKIKRDEQNIIKPQFNEDNMTMPYVIKAKPISSILAKEWRDPPKRKTIPVRGRR